MIGRDSFTFLGLLILSLNTTSNEACHRLKSQLWWPNDSTISIANKVRLDPTKLDSETKESISVEGRAFTTNPKLQEIKATESKISMNKAYGEKYGDDYYDAVDGDYIYYDNDKPRNQVTPGNYKQQSYSLPRRSVAPVSKMQYGHQALQPCQEIHSGHYSSFESSSPKAISSLRLADTVSACLPWTLLAAALPLLIVRPSVTTSTVTITETTTMMEPMMEPMMPPPAMREARKKDIIEVQAIPHLIYVDQGLDKIGSSSSPDLGKDGHVSREDFSYLGAIAPTSIMKENSEQE